LGEQGFPLFSQFFFVNVNPHEEVARWKKKIKDAPFWTVEGRAARQMAIHIARVGLNCGNTAGNRTIKNALSISICTYGHF
jgi:hypothetical protein